MSEMVRVRFAPSPTGYLHVGGARSALFNYLFARHHGGAFILRIEDTDQSRFIEGAMEEIYESLSWLGLDWDEGPQKGGEFGPYLQSQRLDIYSKHAQQLLQSDNAYRCFCTPERLSQVRAEQEKSGQLTGYDRHCRDLTEEQINDNLSNNIPFVIRLKIPFGRVISFNDMIRGEISYKSDVLDDLVLIKTDGFPTYHMANVVDDHLMGITHVLRGDEWIASTPRHVLLYEAFGWELPKFAHLPIILSSSGGKLSKRKGAASVMDYKKAGFLPEALFNFLSLLGWAPGDDREKMSLKELIEAFSIEQVSAKSSVFDENKLEWMNGLYLAEREAQSLLPEISSEWKERGWLTEQFSFGEDYQLRVIDMLKVRSRKLTELVENSEYFFVDPSSYEKKAAGKHFNPKSAEILKELSQLLERATDFNQTAIEEIFRGYAQEKELSMGKLVHPVRLAVSGVSFGPGLFELLSTLGKETVVRRINKAYHIITD
ncbi:Glutamyl-tRNA synthetase [Chitinispirillum alkaliphilum]|nr:Glutamyl-tRNA synthetase [Chitinispirillum alkaliphilum]